MTMIAGVNTQQWLGIKDPRRTLKAAAIRIPIKAVPHCGKIHSGLTIATTDFPIVSLVQDFYAMCIDC